MNSKENEEKKIKGVIFELDAPDMTLLNSVEHILPPQIKHLPRKKQAIALNELDKWRNLVKAQGGNSHFISFHLHWPCWHEYRDDTEKVIEGYLEKKRRG